jgi:predicted dehydrogenase
MKLGIIGTNFISDWMMAAKQQVPEISAVAVYSRTEEKGCAFAKRHHLEHVYTDFSEFANSSNFDAVYIASPVCMHFSQALSLLIHGKHVLCEKPATSCADELMQLVATAKQNNLVFMEAMRFAYDDSLPIVAEALPQIGTLRQASFYFCKYSSRYDDVRAGLNGINAFNPSLSNAALMDLGCYCIHGLIYLFGKPSSVFASSYFLSNGFEAGGIALLSYPGFTGEAMYSKTIRHCPPCMLLGEDGTIFLDSINHTTCIWLQRKEFPPEILRYTEKLPNNMMFELREFYTCVDRQIFPEKQIINSILTHEVMDDIRRQVGIVFPGDSPNF